MSVLYYWVVHTHLFVYIGYTTKYAIALAVKQQSANTWGEVRAMPESITDPPFKTWQAKKEW